MQLTMFPGYPDLVGRRQIFVAYGVGPAVYNQTTGDVISLAYERYIDCIDEVPQDPTGTYYAVARPSFAGPRATWALHYYPTNSATEVANNSTALAAINFVVSGKIGEY